MWRKTITGGYLVASSRSFSNKETLYFMIILSFVCAFILSALAALLQTPQEEAKELDRSKEMLIAARIYNHQGYFQIEDKGNFFPAKYIDHGELERVAEIIHPSTSEILDVVRARIVPFFVDDKGDRHTVEEAKINLDEYIAKNKKKGYSNLPLKLIYEILPNHDPQNKGQLKPIGYIIPVSGFGLWDYIYGYIAIQPNGDDVIGISWYEQKETPGLGANIAEAPWQSLFPGKKIFQEDSSGKSDFSVAPIGITVVRGKVRDVLGASPKSKSAVDGMAGATLTGNGVTKAYKESLTPYRPFFIKCSEMEVKS